MKKLLYLAMIGFMAVMCACGGSKSSGGSEKSDKETSENNPGTLEGKMELFISYAADYATAKESGNEAEAKNLLKKGSVLYEEMNNEIRALSESRGNKFVEFVKNLTKNKRVQYEFAYFTTSIDAYNEGAEVTDFYKSGEGVYDFHLSTDSQNYIPRHQRVFN